jgi:Tfp pilus assembly protein PilV
MWGRLHRVLLRARSEERGFTLLEAMITASLLTVVLSAVLSLGATAQRIAPKDRERADVLRDAQIGLYSMTRQLRQAYAINVRTATQMDVNVRVNGVSKRYVYDCNQTHPTKAGMKRCSRWEFATPTVKKTMVDTVSAASFTYEPASAPTFVRVTLTIPAKGDVTNGARHSDVLDDGFYMRNLDLYG